MEHFNNNTELVVPSMLRMIRAARCRQHPQQLADGTVNAGDGSMARRRSEIMPAALASSLSVDRRHSIDGTAVTRAVSTRSVLGRRMSTRSQQKVESTTTNQVAANQENSMSLPPPPVSVLPPPIPTALGDVTNFDAAAVKSDTVACPPRGCTPSVPSAKPCAGGATATVSTCTSTPGSTEEVEDFDLIRAEDPQYVTEYTPDIYRVLQREEANLLPTPSYMDKQANLNAKMRAILIDWLVDVHKKYKLRAETLFQAISLVDRFLERRQQTQRRQLQLVGVTALLIAAKFEELHPPQINDFVYVTDKAYTRQEVLKMEVVMLSVLEFQVCRPNAAHFLERYSQVNGCTGAHRDLAQYLLELTLVDYKMIRYAPSHLAAGALLLSNKLLRRQPVWTPVAVKHTKLTEQMLKGCAREMCALLEGAEASTLQAVRKKYSNPKYHAVAKLSFMDTAPGFPLCSSTMAGEDEACSSRSTSGGRSLAIRRRTIGTASTEQTKASSEEATESAQVAPMDIAGC